MKVKRYAEAQPYDSPNHWDVRALRLQGMEDGGAERLSVGLSHFLPGGGAGPDASPFEKVYVVLSGEMTVIVDGRETILGRLDSCTIAAGEERKIVNHGNDVCTMLVVIPTVPT